MSSSDAPMSRTARIQHFIAGQLIRPTSVATGTQRNQLSKGWNGRLRAADIESQEQGLIRSRNSLPKLKENLSTASGLLDIYKSIPESEPGRNSHVKRQQDQVDSMQRHITHLERNTSVYTNRHLWAAALLGRRATNWALSDDNPKMGEWAHTDLGRTINKDTGDLDLAVKPADIGEDKARHYAETADLPRLERLKARIAPWHANVHEMSDGYGGPEEGGWWFSQGTPVGSTRGYMTRRGAERAAKRLSAQFTPGKRNITNISPSDAYQADYDQGAFNPVEYTDNMADAMGMPSRFVEEPLDEDFDYSHFGQKSNDYSVSVTRGELGAYPRVRPHYE